MRSFDSRIRHNTRVRVASAVPFPTWRVILHGMAMTEGDKLFERYLLKNGWDPGPHEPDLSSAGIEKRPDFVASRGELRVAFEVKEFAAGKSNLEKRLSEQRTLSASDNEVFGPIRNQVKSASEQLRPLRTLGIPLVVVLSNPQGAMVNLRVENVLSALYGGVVYSLPINPETGGGSLEDGRFEFGRGGKFTNHHQYISALALLRQRENRADRISEIAEEMRDGPPPRDYDTAFEEAVALLNRLDEEELPDGDYLYCDVIETASDSAVPLPSDCLNGDRDTRWKLNSQGVFEATDDPKPR